MLVHYFSHAGSETGPGRAARDWIKALELAGCEVVVRSIVDAPTTQLVSGVAIYHGSPAQLEAVGSSRSSITSVAVTTWETSRLPAYLAHGLARFDAVIVPSEFCVEIIGSLPVKVLVVPHCFDPAEWEPRSKSAPGPFTFYTIGGWGERKNVLGVLRAYLHEFRRSDEVQLVIVSQGIDFEMIHSTIARSALPLSELPGLRAPDAEFSASEIVKLHQDADCFVSATRGEGWGLGMFEAMVMQRPVVAPSRGGQHSFLHGFESSRSRQWFGVPALRSPVFAGEGDVKIGNGQVSGRLRLPNGADARQLWFEPDLERTAEQMRAVYDRFHQSRDYSCYEQNRENFEDRFSAPVVGSMFRSALKEISGS